MLEKIRDKSFAVVVVFLIAVGIYWILEQLQQDYMDQYINILGEKLISMVPESSEKEALSEVVDQFKTKFEKNEVPPEQLEKIVADVYNYSYLSDTLSLEQARALITVPEAPRATPPQINDKKWRELERKLSTVYRFDEKSRLLPERDLKFRVDQNLKILVDDTIRQAINAGKYEFLTVELQNLEQEKSLVWVKSMDSTMEVIRKQYVELQHQHDLLNQEHNQKLNQVLAITVDSIQAAISVQMDSINYKYHFDKNTDVKIIKTE